MEAWQTGAITAGGTFGGLIFGTFFPKLFGLIETRESRLWKIQEDRINKLEEDKRELVSRVGHLEDQMRERDREYQSGLQAMVAKYERDLSFVRHQKHHAQGIASNAIMELALVAARANETVKSLGGTALFDLEEIAKRYAKTPPGAIDGPT